MRKLIALAGALALAALFVVPAAAATAAKSNCKLLIDQGKPECKAAAAARGASSDPLTAFINKLDLLKPENIKAAIDALNEADADAGTVVNATTGDVKDPISHACYPAEIKFLQSLPVLQPIKAKAPFNLIPLFQRKRDFMALLKAGLPPYLKVGCAALFGDEATIFVQSLGLVGITGISLAGLGIPAVPALTLPPLLP